jgi:hypothetical protein
MREYWGKSLCFMLALGLVCASSAARADFVCQHLDDDHPGVTVRLTDFAELQPSLLDPGLPPSLPGSLFYESRLPRSPRERFASVFMPDWDTYAASYSGRQIDGIDLTSLLADAPAMFGNFFHLGGYFSCSFGSSELPLAGNSGRMSVADNNRALTQDRVYFAYNHFHNASRRTGRGWSGEDGSIRTHNASVDRYTFGVEKTFFDGLWSIELRMPFANTPLFSSSFQYDDEMVYRQFGMLTGSVGNLSVMLKKIMWVGTTGSAVIGLAVETPTGSSVKTFANYFGEDYSFAEEYLVRNRSVYLVPYLGLLLAPQNGFFLQSFLQLSTPTNGNPVHLAYWDSDDPGFVESERVGTLMPLTLFHLDVSGGRWLYRNHCPDGRTRRGVAAVLEFHYATAVSGVDYVDNFSGAPVTDDFEFKTYLADFTVGLHVQFDTNSIARFGAAFPLLDSTRRIMDSELIAQFERRF